jgi:type I restriction enzyme S subunit
MGHIQRHHLTDALCVVPDDKVLSGVESIFSELIDRGVANELQSRTLGALRDTPLPKLISAQLRISEAGAILAEADA